MTTCEFLDGSVNPNSIICEIVRHGKDTVCKCVQDYRDCLANVKLVLENYEKGFDQSHDAKIYDMYAKRDASLFKTEQMKLEIIQTGKCVCGLYYNCEYALFADGCPCFLKRDELDKCFVQAFGRLFNCSFFKRMIENSDKDLAQKRLTFDQFWPQFKIVKSFLDTLDEKPNVCRYWWLDRMKNYVDHILLFKDGAQWLSPPLIYPICLGKLKNFNYNGTHKCRVEALCDEPCCAKNK